MTYAFYTCFFQLYRGKLQNGFSLLKVLASCSTDFGWSTKRLSSKILAKTTLADSIDPSGNSIIGNGVLSVMNSPCGLKESYIVTFWDDDTMIRCTCWDWQSSSTFFRNIKTISSMTMGGALFALSYRRVFRTLPHI